MEEFTTQSYVICVKNRAGTRLYLGGQKTTNLTTNPGEAFQFGIEDDKSEIIAFIDKYRSTLNKHEPDTICVMVFETTLRQIDVTEHDWATALRRNAVKKLTTMEIKALGVEKHEIERRMADR